MVPATPILFWENFDFITIGALFAVIGYILFLHYRRTGSVLGTISQTVAHSKTSSRLFSVSMTIFFPLYYAFIWFWVGPLAQMPTYFYYLLAFSAVCEMVFVWVPATAGKSKKVHEVMAGIVGAVMFAAPLMFLVYGKGLSTLATLAAVIFLVLSIGLGLLLLSPKLRRYTFIYEVLYCLFFLLTISAIAHT